MPLFAPWVGRPTVVPLSAVLPSPTQVYISVSAVVVAAAADTATSLPTPLPQWVQPNPTREGQVQNGLLIRVQNSVARCTAVDLRSLLSARVNLVPFPGARVWESNLFNCVVLAGGKVTSEKPVGKTSAAPGTTAISSFALSAGKRLWYTQSIHYISKSMYT